MPPEMLIGFVEKVGFDRIMLLMMLQNPELANNPVALFLLRDAMTKRS